MSSKLVNDGRMRSYFNLMQVELDSRQTNDVTQKFALDRQKTRCRKRALFSDLMLSDVAVQTFIDNNNIVGSFKPHIRQDVADNARLFIAHALESYTKSVNPDNIQESLDIDHLFSLWRFGPGASNGIRGTHCVQKIEQEMTCTSKCVPFIKKLRADNVYFRANDGIRNVRGYTVIKGSRLATVQKNEDTDRTIAIEPSGNMAMQLAAGMYLEGTLRSIGLDITCQQDYNNLLALSGSITNRLATVDMRFASDMISCSLVQQLLPPDWWILLSSIRSESIELPDGRTLKLEMISTMGNGFTFPLMTLIILALIYATRAVNNVGRNLHIDWLTTSVFGDDIVILSTEYPAICDVLCSAGFVINFDKSYSDGPFRESCGGDYYAGVDVTPFYVKTLATEAQIYVAINQQLQWSAKTNIWLPLCYDLLVSYIGKVPFLVPEWHNPDEGILCSTGPVRYKYLQTAAVTQKYKENIFFVMLAIGGYLTPSGPDCYYTPRTRKSSKSIVRKLRIPKGYLSGWDPKYRSQLESAAVSCFIGS